MFHQLVLGVDRMNLPGKLGTRSGLVDLESAQLDTVGAR